MTPIITLNFNQSGNPEGTALYTSRYGATTPRDTTRQTAEAGLRSLGKRGDTLLFVRRGVVSASSGSSIPTDGAVLAAYGTGLRTKEVQAMADDDTVRILLATLPRIEHTATPAMIIGGWPRILRDGQNVAGDAATVEGTISRNAEMRHPRTAVGFSRDSSILFLLTVDGRSESSGGMSTVELANMMRRLGAKTQAAAAPASAFPTNVSNAEAVNGFSKNCRDLSRVPAPFTSTSAYPDISSTGKSG